MVMRFHRVRDITMQIFLVYWRPGDTHLADYHTKFHSPSHHQKQRPLHVHTDDSPKYITETQRLGLRGCVNYPDHIIGSPEKSGKAQAKTR